jgi:hypothetical protein
MHEIILILLGIGIAAIPTGFFVKHDIKEVVVNNPVYERKAKEPDVDISAELDMEHFNALSKDVQDILLKYL